MKKSNLIVGILYLAAGLGCLFAACLVESRLDGLLFGFAGAGIGPGLLLIGKYFYWSQPEKKERYQEKLEREKIEQQDELKEKLRDRSGRYAYVLGILTVCLSMVVFSVLGTLEIVQGSRTIVLYLGGFLVFQITAGIVIFNHLLARYE